MVWDNAFDLLHVTAPFLPCVNGGFTFLSPDCRETDFLPRLHARKCNGYAKSGETGKKNFCGDGQGS